MIQEPLSESVKNAVNILRTLINEREAMPEQISEMGWRYGGSKFLYMLNQLREVLLHEGIDVGFPFFSPLLRFSTPSHHALVVLPCSQQY